ncbi:MAG: hypothetical protein ACKOE0_08210 [Actinomycetes bacterium]
MCNRPALPRRLGSHEHEDEEQEQDVDVEDVEVDDETEEYDSDEEMHYERYEHEGEKYVAYTSEFYQTTELMAKGVERLKDMFIRPGVPHHVADMIMHARRLVHPTSPHSLFSSGILCVHPTCQASIMQLARHVFTLSQHLDTEPRTEHKEIAKAILFFVNTFANAVLPLGDPDAETVMTNLDWLRAHFAAGSTVPIALHPFLAHTEHICLERFGNPDGWDEEGIVPEVPAGEQAHPVAVM